MSDQLVINTFEKVNAKYADSNDSTVQELLSHMRRLKESAVKKLHPPNLKKEQAERAIKNAEREIAKARQENKDPQLIHQANKHLEYAKQQKRTNHYEKSISAAKKAIEIIKASLQPQPPDPQHYVDEGNIFFEQSELEKALEKVEQALNLDRNYSPAHTLKSKIKKRYAARGRRFFEEEKDDEAIDAFKSAVSINIHPELKEAYNYLGVIYIGQRQYREAIAFFSKAVRIDANFKEAYFNSALAHLELGEFEGAIKAAEAALRIDPNYEPPRMLIELVLTQF